jgi:hypothetical protein
MFHLIAGTITAVIFIIAVCGVIGVILFMARKKYPQPVSKVYTLEGTFHIDGSQDPVSTQYRVLTGTVDGTVPYIDIEEDTLKMTVKDSKPFELNVIISDFTSTNEIELTGSGLVYDESRELFGNLPLSQNVKVSAKTPFPKYEFGYINHTPDLDKSFSPAIAYFLPNSPTEDQTVSGTITLQFRRTEYP